ncbi:TORTIFOLIA1-like protein 4 [Impatiens glandulifera]|uniref:TORTIFOLIA1-like protein 4 n=1 Tax=Impatiens glandulifera TaxID=253017 RepID=UPI001FB1802B|nr:TORTIFOLIA1-like protein 4 [Impatiens glandulifera]
MSFSRGSPQNGNGSNNTDLKQRVFACLNKLSDRDTLAVASAELDSIAKTLPQEAFSPFISCLSSTDSSEKSPVRRQCVRLLGLMSSAHGDALSPHVSKMLSAVVRRLRDSDSAVRAACVEAVGSMASQITRPPFSSFMKPLVEAVLHEQDQNSQVGSALCLATAIESAPDPEPAQLQKLLLKLLKLVKSESFKAKASLLWLIGITVSVGGAGNRNAVNGLVHCLVEFLSSDDWGTRKAAAEALGKLAIAEKGLSSDIKSSCLSSLENRRFDKVKVVRETMNRTLEMWKEIPETNDDGGGVAGGGVSKDESGNGSRPHPPTPSNGSREESPKPKTSPPMPSSNNNKKKNSSTPTTITRKSSPPTPKTNSDDKRSGSSSIFNNLLYQTTESSPNWNVAISEKGVPGGLADTKGNAKQAAVVVDTNATDEKTRSRFRSSRVVPLFNDDFMIVGNTGGDESEMKKNHKGVEEEEEEEEEDLSLIRRQLLQIEDQQSSLLHLLQRFIGSSQNGIESLETRVNGIEKALDEISRAGVGVGAGRRLVPLPSSSTCCSIPGAEFLTPRYWRRSESSSHLTTTNLSYSSGRRILNHQQEEEEEEEQMTEILKQQCQNNKGGMSCGDNRRKDLRTRLESSQLAGKNSKQDSR